MPRDDAKDAGQQAHARRRHPEARKKPGEPKPYWPVEIKIENSLDLARFVGGFYARARRLCPFRHRFSRAVRIQKQAGH